MTLKLELLSGGGLKARPLFGQHVRASAIMIKRHDWRGDKRGYATVWRRIAKTVEGLYIGYRDVYEGLYRFGNDWDQYERDTDRTLRVWLIVPNQIRNPVYVLPDDVHDYVIERIP